MPLAQPPLIRLALVVAALSLTTAARADVSVPSFAGPVDNDRIFRSPVGSWVEYEYVGASHRMVVRYALIKKSADGFTLEMTATLLADPNLASIGRTIYQMDYTTDGKQWRVVRTREKFGDDPVRERPPQPERPPAAPPTPIPGAEERIATPAGTFLCRRARLGDQQLWITSSLPLLGMVKMSMTQPVPATITLRAVGGEARPSF